MTTQDNTDPEQTIIAISQQDLLRCKIDEAFDTDEPPIDGNTYIQKILQRFQQAKDDRRDFPAIFSDPS